MLTAALDGLVARFGIAGERVGEVVAGAVLKHARDFNLTRECVLGSALDHATPAYDVQQACDTGLEATVLVANKIALGQIDSGIAGGVDTTSDAPIEVNDDLRRVLLDHQRREEPGGAGQAARPPAPVPDRARDPAQRRAPHGPLDGRARGAHREASGASPRLDQDELAAASHQKLAGRIRARLLRRPRHALPGTRARPEPAPGLHPGEARQAEARVREG